MSVSNVKTVNENNYAKGKKLNIIKIPNFLTIYLNCSFILTEIT